ncbi:helix-turn-helix domain-containing protein [Acinetobacter radioresistens]|uniref:helix-turn-helix domain-containing protein n=1 Tax=Acinetobacter radioresistens TaxID=40216 RepID=UPI0021CDB724|nr:XRE family transcriptional regulator [Acinetobacter radioresistens]
MLEVQTMLGIEKFEPERLQLARQMYDDLSKTALAEMINVAPSTVKKWEDGTHSPQPEVLASLADALRIPMHWFLRKVPIHGDPVFLNRAKKRVLKAPCSRSNAMLINLAEIHSIADEWISFPKVDLIAPLSREEALSLNEGKIQILAEKLRAHWGLGLSPIPNLTKRLERAGITITRFEIGYEDMDGTSAWINDKPYIFIAADKHNFYRSRFDLAHELGHIIMHKNLTQDDKKDWFDKLEDQAHYFANCFLFPINAFIAETRSRISLESLMLLKKRWGISLAAMIFKARNLNIISEEQYTKLWRSFRYRGYTKSEPYDEATSPEEPTLVKNTIMMLLEQGGFDKANIIDKFALKKHLELLAGLPKGFLDDDFGQLISMKPQPSKQSMSEKISSPFKSANIIKFSRN